MKEIVITNPNGITLNTKKTLVDDDIKILLDQSLLNQGGSGELMLKLVATGTYNEEDEGFDLRKELEEGKVYLIDYYSSSLGHHNTGVLYHASEKETCSCVVSCNTTSDGEDFCCLLYIRGMILIYSSPYGDIATTEDDYIKVYELATTSESISEPTSNIKVAEIKGVYDEENEIFTFKKDGLNIDYFKGFRIEIIDNNNNDTILEYYGLGKLVEETVNNSTNLYCGCYGYDNYGTYEYNLEFQNMSYIYGVTFYNNGYDAEFVIDFTSDLTTQLATNLDELTFKLYYTEANELTTPFTYES